MPRFISAVYELACLRRQPQHVLGAVFIGADYEDNYWAFVRLDQPYKLLPRSLGFRLICNLPIGLRLDFPNVGLIAGIFVCSR
jgi:hypothetical protein